MCFLPQPCLKFIVGIGALISIIIAVGLLAVTVYANIQKATIVDSISQGIVNTVLVGLYVSSIIFLMLGIAGLYGAAKGINNNSGKSKCLIGFFSIGVFIFFALFLTGTIFFLVGPETIFGKDCHKGTQSTLIEDLDGLVSIANNQFCGVNCGCNLNATNIDSFLGKKLKDAGKNVSSTNIATRYQDCSSFDKVNETLALTIASLEKSLQCSGWCNTDDVNQYFRFTNINDCVSEQCLGKMSSCYNKFESFMKDKGVLIALVCGGAALISLLNIITVICICCHPGNKGKKRNFYSRMLQTD